LILAAACRTPVNLHITPPHAGGQENRKNQVQTTLSELTKSFLRHNNKYYYFRENG
jgi:hypothetical protein